MLKEYEIKVTTETIVYADGETEEEAMSAAEIEALYKTDPDKVSMEVLSVINEEDADITICGEHGCDGCLYQHSQNIDLCKQEAAKRGIN